MDILEDPWEKNSWRQMRVQDGAYRAALRPALLMTGVNVTLAVRLQGDRKGPPRRTWSGARDLLQQTFERTARSAAALQR